MEKLNRYAADFVQLAILKCPRCVDIVPDSTPDDSLFLGALFFLQMSAEFLPSQVPSQNWLKKKTTSAGAFYSQV